ncbi:OmpA family protein [Actinomadura montaniterrae]|uniref:OmpA family protein n=1 Tax=Actinomadura montaniterrae TaxID=1803903 RepID=A0A6L3VYC7_9ACTN|nr:OmpA family protein [Actinomadura montaniterrae]KAB2385940.1 OmpA family protein [Actinomadura montaniterrae]
MRARALQRASVVVGFLAVFSSVSGTASSDPSVNDVNIQQSVRAIGTDRYVYSIDAGTSVLPLETVKNDGKRVTMRISADLLFDFDKADLTAAARRRISQLAPQLKSAVGAIEVSGHSDSIGDPSYNQTLSQKRAESVKSEIERVLGGGKEIKATGYGESKPIAPNQVGGRDNPDGRAQNRRVEIEFTKP